MLQIPGKLHPAITGVLCGVFGDESTEFLEFERAPLELNAQILRNIFVIAQEFEIFSFRITDLNQHVATFLKPLLNFYVRLSC